MKILVVEDNQERIDLLKQWTPERFSLVIVTSAGRAVKTIELDSGFVYSGILLDHDLNEQIVNTAELSMDGRDVVRKIIECISIDVPVLIHSMNLTGRMSMYRMLHSNGFHVEIIPFNQMNRSTFMNWLEEVETLQ